MSAPTASLDGYVAQLTSSDFLTFCTQRTQLPYAAVEQRLRDYAREVAVGVNLLEGVLRPGLRVLEVGAGLGLLAIWLARQGHTIVLLEPGEGGFGVNNPLLEAALEWFEARLPVLSIAAEHLDPVVHGTFDVVFSVNVLEHVPALEPSLEAMVGVLAPAGVMRHACPNYTVPYEPHYELPLLPLAPRVTGLLVPHIARQDVWRSLNFITYGRIVRFCRAHGLAYEFDRGVMAAAFRRMETDPAFRARRSAPMQRLQPVLRRTGLLAMLERLPPRYATPMVFSCWRA